MELKSLVNDISGIGSFSSNGGRGSVSRYKGCGGGGGRIAVYYKTGNFNFDNTTAYGGTGALGNGGEGTIYVKNEATGIQQMLFSNNNNTPQYSTPVWFGERNNTSDDPADYIFDLYASNNAWFNFEGDTELIINQFNLTTGARFDSADNVKTSSMIISGAGAHLSTPEIVGVEYLKVDGAGAYLETDIINVTGTIDVLNGAKLTSLTTTTSTEHSLTINAQIINIDESSSIDVSYCGYRENRTVGNVGWSDNRAGGSYGGYGGLLDGPKCNVYGNLWIRMNLAVEVVHMIREVMAVGLYVSRLILLFLMVKFYLTGRTTEQISFFRRFRRWN